MIVRLSEQCKEPLGFISLGGFLDQLGIYQLFRKWVLYMVNESIVHIAKGQQKHGI
jgi:hypothetical protein